MPQLPDALMRYSTDQLIDRIRATARGIGFPESIAVEQLREESGFLDSVVYGPRTSSAGAMGLAQFMPGTWARFGSGNPYDPDDALRGWANYINYLRGLFGDDYFKILQSYVGGEGHVLNPARFGQPSAEANRYANAILARSQVSNSPTHQQPGFDLSNFSVLGLSPVVSTVGILAFAAFLIVAATDDT